MKDSDYFGFSTDDDGNDYKVVDLDDNSEDDFKVIDLIHFDTEEDVRIVELANCERGRERYTKNAGGADDMPYSSISALKPRATRKKRMIQSMVVVGLVCAFLLVFLGNSTVVRTAIASRFTKATPASVSTQLHLSESMSLTIDSDRFYIALYRVGEPVSIDGQVLAHVPMIGVDPPVHLGYGRHILRWQTGDYQTMACTVSVPPSFADTCEYEGPQPIQSGLAVWIIGVPRADFAIP